MNIKLKLTVLSFLQFFVWGAWLITIGVYWFGTKQWGGEDFGKVFTAELAIAPAGQMQKIADIAIPGGVMRSSFGITPK